MPRFGKAFAGATLALALGASGSSATATSDAVAPPRGAELERLAQPPTHSALAGQRIYFVLPDRYANGDPTNDRGGATGARSVTGYDPADIGWYHGGDLKGLTGSCTDPRTGLARVRDLGFTAIWLAPVVVQQWVQGDSAAYHGYWGLDFTRVDPHLGTNADFAAFVNCAHSLGLKVYLDIVVNHTADVILLSGGTSYRSPAEEPYRDCKGRPFSAQRYAGGKRFPCLSARFQPRQPVVLPEKRKLKRPAWLNDVRRYHNRGDITFDSCSSACFEQGDFFGLDDVFTEQPVVVAGLAKVWGDWIRAYRIDGFRVDTAKHLDRAFFRSWVPKIRAAARAGGVQDVEIFGEVTLSDAAELAIFARERRIPSVLDFPLQDSLVRFSGGSAGALGISSRLADDDYFRRPDGLAPAPATFLGNHDLGRAALLVKQQAAGATDLELARRVQLAHSLLFLLRGAPVVYYGDEVGMIGRGGDKAARQDMFPTQVAEWRTEERVFSFPPIGTNSSFDVIHTLGNNMRILGRLRDEHPALVTGGTFVRHASEGVLAISRIDRESRHEYLTVFNAGREPARVTFRTATPSSFWYQLYGQGAPLSTDAGGRTSVTVPPLEGLLYRATAELPRLGPARLTPHVKPDRFTNLVRIGAAAGSVDPLSVTFAVRREGAWQRLGVDDGAPYGVFVDPREFPRGRPVSFVAAARASDGSVSASRVVTAVIRR